MFGHDNRELAAVFVGGAVGTALRTVVATILPAPPGQWPWPTFTVNIVGALLLGYFTTRLLDRSVAWVVLPRIATSRSSWVPE